MITDYKKIKHCLKYKVMDMDGFGKGLEKIDLPDLYREPVMFTGFKLF
jgi:hypothetical protein